MSPEFRYRGTWHKLLFVKGDEGRCEALGRCGRGLQRDRSRGAGRSRLPRPRIVLSPRPRLAPSPDVANDRTNEATADDEKVRADIRPVRWIQDLVGGVLFLVIAGFNQMPERLIRRLEFLVEVDEGHEELCSNVVDGAKRTGVSLVEESKP